MSFYPALKAAQSARTPKPRGVGVTLGFWAVVFLIGLGSDAAEPKRLRVVTTILPAYSFAANVIGPHGEVHNLLPPNIGPHDYQLSPNDVRRLKGADLVIFNGLGLDNWILKALSAEEQGRALELGRQFKTEIIQAAHEDSAHAHDHDHKKGEEHEHDHKHQHGPGNPHFWLDPQLAIRCVTNILAAVQKADPARAADYQKNADAYIERLKKLDAEIAERLAQVKDKAFVTQHDAFPYFIRRYGLTLACVLELTPDVSPSPRYLRDLLRIIREKKVQVLFSEPQASKRLANRVAQDAKIKLGVLETLETGKIDATAYEDGMRRNAQTLARELK